jgi:hypothetical protein
MKLKTLKTGLQTSMMLAAVPAYLLMMSGCSTTDHYNRTAASDDGRGGGHSAPVEHVADHGPGDEHNPNFGHSGPQDGDHHDVHVVAHVHDKVSFHGGHLPEGWSHWAHPVFARPIYHFDWNHVAAITCVAQDANGDQYPITDNTYPYHWDVNMPFAEDEALDFCHNTDMPNQALADSCFLASCTPN